MYALKRIYKNSPQRGHNNFEFRILNFAFPNPYNLTIYI